MATTSLTPNDSPSASGWSNVSGIASNNNSYMQSATTGTPSVTLAFTDLPANASSVTSMRFVMEDAAVMSKGSVNSELTATVVYDETQLYVDTFSSWSANLLGFLGQIYSTDLTVSMLNGITVQLDVVAGSTLPFLIDHCYIYVVYEEAAALTGPPIQLTSGLIQLTSGKIVI